MKIRYVGPKKSILVLAVGIIICWAVAGNASEQWDAMTFARINLRKTPSLRGEILSTLSKGQKLRILQKKGPWWKVDVKGEINGKGWVYSKYLERILPKTVEIVSSSQTVRIKITSEEQNQGIHPVALLPKARADGEEVKPLKAPLPEKPSIAGVREKSSAGKELRESKNETGILSKREIPKAEEPADMVPFQVPHEVRTEDEKAKPLNASLPAKVSMVGLKEQVSVRKKLQNAKNESNVLSLVDIPIAGEPVHMPSAQPPYSGFKQDELEISEKDFSGVIEPGDSTTYPKSLPGAKKKHGGAVPRTPPAVSEPSAADARAVASSVIRSAVSHETKGLIYKRESMGRVTIALKLLSIMLSGLVILLLYKKIDVEI